MASSRIYAVVWTWRHNRGVKTKKRGREVMRVWKKWYERQGWHVHSSGPDAYVATSPEGTRHSVVFHEYDAATKARIDTPIRVPKPRVVSDAPKPRRGRGKPAYV